MDIRRPLYQAIASALAGLLFLNPIVAAAAQLAVDAAAGGNTQIGAAGNGVPIVNIATPNGSGLSHNKFSDYGVGQQGLILNNATGKTQGTQLGGIILGNPNLKGQAAQKILNEVTGGSPSQLKGYTEVAGQGAHVIVANPHGITCNGCGFINTPRATLTTGKPILAGERLQGYDVDGGEIAIEGAGLNASNLDQFELITRSAKLNADLYAKQLTVVAGRNTVDAQTLAATAKPDDGSAKPQLAIDSSALGGMYANTIRLVGTEQGVGVKLAGNMAASAGDIRIDANGKLELAQVAASGNLALKGQDVALNGPAYAGGSASVQASGALSNAQSLAARQGVQLRAGSLDNAGQIVAGIEGEQRIAGQGLDIAADLVGNRGRLDATGSLKVAADTLDNAGQAYAERIDVDARRQLDNRGTLQGREVALRTRQFNNLGDSAQLIGERSLLLDAPAVVNLGGLVRFGDGQAASLNFTSLDNRNGRLEVNGGSLTLAGGTLDNQQGRIVAGSARIDAQRIDNAGGLIGTSGGDLALNSQGELNNAGGKLQAAQALRISAGAVDNRAGTQVGDSIDLAGSSLDNRLGGVLSAERGDLDLRLSGAFDNAAGLAQASGALLLDVGNLANAAGTLVAQSLDLISHGAVDNSGGTLAAERLSLNAQSLANRNGRVQADSALTLTAGDLDNANGLLLGGTLQADLASISDNAGGTLSADGALKLTVAQTLNNALGRLQSVQGNLDVTAGSLDNRQGALAGAQLLLQTSGALDNRGGRIVGDGIQASAGVIDNSGQGLLVAGADGLALTAQQRLSNDQGRIQSDAGLRLQAPQLENRGGVVLGQRVELLGGNLDNSQGGAVVGNGEQLSLSLDGVLNNATGLIDAGDQALLFSRAVGQLDNRGGTLRGERLDVLAGSIDNSASGRLLAGAAGLSVTAGALNNQRGLVHAQGGAVTAALGAGSLQNQAGTVQGDSVAISAASLDNSQADGEAGSIASLLGKLELVVGNLINRGGQLFGKSELSVTGNTLDNGGGQLSGGRVVLASSGALNNQGGLIESATSLELDSGTLDNSQGGRLRALGGDSSHIRSAGQLNNQGGSIGVASQAFELGSGAALLNGQGQVQHAGTGLFRLGAGSLVGAGSLTGLGEGQWQLGSVANAGQMRVNGALDLRVGQGLEVGAGERIASAGNLSVTAAYLNNQGELLSDGDLGLSLSDDAYNAGLLSAQRNFTLNAGNFTQQGGRLASGLDTRLSLAGNLDNQGWLIANQALHVSAAQVNNTGTLGALGALDIASQGIANGADSLLFSGGDMTLRAASLSNRYGDLYSQGNLSFAGQDGGRAQSLSNRSGTIEAQGDIHLDVASLENARDVFAFEQITTFGEFDVQCGQHCGGHDSFKRGKIDVNETLSERITQNSPAAWLTAGGNLTIDAGAVENRNSTLAANGDLTINADSLLNQGNTSRTGNKVVVINVVPGDYGKIPTGQWDTMENLARAFNTKMAAGTFDQDLYDQLWAIYNGDRWAIGTPVVTWSEDGAQSAPATLQAGNRVTLNVAHNLQNGTVSEYSLAQLTGQLAGSLLGGQLGTVNLTLNKQSSDAQASGPQTVQSVTHTAADGSQQVSFIPVDYSGVPFAAVDPTAADTFRLPQGQYGMFIRSPDPQSHYLIESNPALTDLGRFLNSDYLLGKLGFDPDQAWKRLGDGAYETRLIREAIQAQTGQRFLDGLTSDYDQFQYLMDNALAAKDALQLSVGVGLSAEQVAALTHDIVWMETRVIDGQQVLVPVVYLAQTDARNLRGGSLIQGRDLNLMAGGDLVNVGTLRASEDLSASAGGSILQGGLMDAGQRVSLLAGDSIRNALAGQIRGEQVDLTALKGDIVNDRTAVTVGIGGDEYRSFLDAGASISARSDLSLDAGRDITNRGSLASGGDSYLGAGRDINLQAVTDASRLRDIQQGGHHVTTTTVAQNHGSSLTAGGDLVLDAGRDLNVVGSQASAKGDLTAAAGRDINLSAVEDAASVEVRSKTSSSRTVEQTGQTRQLGAELTAGGDLVASAGQDLNLTASTISASNEAYLYASRDVNLQAAAETDSHALSKTKRSHGLLSSSEKKTEDTSLYTTQKGSLVSADKIAIRAGQDIGVSGSDVASTNGTSLLAGRNVLIDGATETSETSHAESKKKSGVMSSGGLGFTLGSASTQATQTSHSEQTRGSTIGSVLGNVDIQAGKDLTIRGSDVVAGKDINLIGQNVDILAAQNENRSEQTYKSKSSGLTLALSGTVGSAMDAGYQTAKQARHEDDSRLSALQGIKAGLTGVQAWQAAQQGTEGGGVSQFFGISASLGSQKSSSRQTQEQSVSQGSSLTAGNNLNILATGSGAVGQDGDIRIQGSQLKAGNDMLLAANRDILLEAAANTQKLDGKNKSSGGAVGVSVGYSADNGVGLSIFANANQGSGKEIGTGTTWTETTLDAGSQVKLVSGRDTTLKGAQVNGEQIIANVGRDLTLQSLQDSDYYDSKQKNVSAGASVAIIGTGGSASVSASQSKIDSNYKSVQEQTGLYAGKGGFQIDVGNHTQLDGSVIASTAEADKNRLSTGTLGWSSIDNKADYKSQQQSVSISSASDGSGKFISNMPSGMLVAYNHGDSASGTTGSAISNGTLEIRDPANQQQDVASLSRDVEHANGSISPIFDKEKEQNRLKQVQLIAEIGTQAMDIVRTQGKIDADREAKKELKERNVQPPGPNASETELEAYQKELLATNAYKEFSEYYGTGGKYQQVTQAVTAALQGLVGGDIGSALAGASAPYLATIIKQQTGNNDTARIMAQAVLGAVVAQMQGNSAVAGAAGAAGGEAIAKVIAEQLYGVKGNDTSGLSEEQKQTISALSTLAAGLAGAAIGSDTAGALAAALAGKTAVENNYLSRRDVDELAEKARTCEALHNCEQLAADAKERSEANRKKLLACKTDCAELRAEVDQGSQAVDALVLQLPEGEAADILGRYTGVGGDNTADWTLAGQLHLDQVANLWWSDDGLYIEEFAKYLTQTGFNPFAIGVPVFAGGGSAKTGPVSEPLGVPFITPEMKANPYHPDWKAYAGGQARGVGADTVDGGPTSKISAYDLKLTKTVENHLNDINKAGDRVRPYSDSRALMQEIMDSKAPVSDPRGVPGALRWDVQGTMNGSKGTYELVVDPRTSTVLHFLFRSSL